MLAHSFVCVWLQWSYFYTWANDNANAIKDTQQLGDVLRF